MPLLWTRSNTHTSTERAGRRPQGFFAPSPGGGQEGTNLDREDVSDDGQGKVEEHKCRCCLGSRGGAVLLLAKVVDGGD